MSTNEHETDELMNAIREVVENAIADAIDDLSATIDDSVQASVQNAIENMLSSFEFTLPNGIQVTPRKKLSVTSSDKTRILLCYGGLRVDGRVLLIQTRIDSWEQIAVYPTKEDAIHALDKVKQAMIDGVEFLDL